MDKYEFNLKIEQIKKLASKKDFQTASKVAKALDLRRVKDWQTLALLIQVHDSAGELEEAREVAVIAYNKNLGGRRLVYKLADICLRLKDYDEANELYKDYVKMAPKDPSRYVLEYKVLKAQKASPDELIEVLEEYREHEIDEKYLCELAYLYSNTGRQEECVEECDEIITLFRDGVYVERAIALKKQYVALSPAQEKVLEEAAIKSAKAALAQETGDETLVQEEEQTLRRQETREMNLVDVTNEEGGEEPAQADSQEEEEPAKQGRFKAFLSKTFLADDEEEDEEDDEDGEDAGEEPEEFQEEEPVSQDTAKAVEEAAAATEDIVQEEKPEIPVAGEAGNIAVGNVEDYAQSNA
ncbi:MAG: tetratricopeptide repeat protein, partial [Lachnospiraceae bacterium]